MARAVKVKQQERIMALVQPLEQKFSILLLGALPEIEFSQKGNKGTVFIHMPSQFCRSNYLLK